MCKQMYIIVIHTRHINIVIDLFNGIIYLI